MKIYYIYFFFFGVVDGVITKRRKTEDSKVNYTLTHSAIERMIHLQEFTKNEREISILYKALPSAVLKISSSLLVNEYR